MRYTKEQIVNKLNIVFMPYLKKEGDDNFTVRNPINGDMPVSFDIPEIAEAASLPLSGYINILGEDSAEYLIRAEESPFIHNIKTADQNYEIELREISDLMCINILMRLPDERYRMLVPAYRMFYSEKSLSIFDFLRKAFRHFHSLFIKKLTDNASVSDDFAKSCLFNIAMSRSANFRLVKNIEAENFERERYVSKRRFELNVPHLVYNDELVEYYISGNAARLPKIKFLSFYNVLEYWFDKTYNEEKCLAIRQIITSPKFSYSNLKHYKKITDIFRSDRGKSSEINLLQETINKYIDVDDFKEFLKNNKFYLENSAHKIPDTKFSLEDTDSNLLKKLSKRIYKVRNAIVHSKESEEEKYFPQDEKHIASEVLLVRYAAEEIIIKSAK